MCLLLAVIMTWFACLTLTVALLVGFAFLGRWLLLHGWQQLAHADALLARHLLHVAGCADVPVPHRVCIGVLVDG